MEQTSVEWLIKRYHDYGTLYYEDMTKAREMEKEQHFNTWTDSRIEYKEDDYIGKEMSFEEYFNETYNK